MILFLADHKLHHAKPNQNHRGEESNQRGSPRDDSSGGNGFLGERRPVGAPSCSR